MSARLAIAARGSIVALLALASGCTIVHEQRGGAAPPPPAHRHRAPAGHSHPRSAGQHASQPAPAAVPAATTKPVPTPAPAGTVATPGRRLKIGPGGMSKIIRGPSTQPPAKPLPAGFGLVDVEIIDGECRITIDGKDFGVARKVHAPAPEGSRVVTCTPAGGPAQRHVAVVRVGDTTAVLFSVQPATEPAPAPPP